MGSEGQRHGDGVEGEFSSHTDARTREGARP